MRPECCGTLPHYLFLASQAASMTGSRIITSTYEFMFQRPKPEADRRDSNKPKQVRTAPTLERTIASGSIPSMNMGKTRAKIVIRAFETDGNPRTSKRRHYTISTDDTGDIKACNKKRLKAIWSLSLDDKSLRTNAQLSGASSIGLIRPIESVTSVNSNEDEELVSKQT